MQHIPSNIHLDTSTTSIALRTLAQRGYTSKLFEVHTTGATNVVGHDTLPTNYTPVNKTLLASLETDLGIVPDNIEGMQMIYVGCGEAVLVILSDNNFSAFVPQSNQFVFLKLTRNF